ncbi:MAG TPA: metal ABC transporter substrate-binding protein, partial [Gemmatales bacterium]|nr:metal ABC transporter substrate-binding protein [Gemmatales bacterium]
IIEAPGEPHYHGDHLVSHTGPDPHVWLGIAEARQMAAAIVTALAEKDAKHAALYRQRGQALDERLAKLGEQGRELKLAGGLVTFHDSFRYFGRSFGITIEGTIRNVRGEESSGAAMAEQAREFKKRNVKLIGVEPQYPRGVAESLAKDMGRDQVRLIELDPIETGPLLPGETHKIDRDWYFKQMEQNLKNLRGEP